ncbi:COX15/CtaA family protein [Micromonospora polyrhachis]|uniref:Cytochrome c oxidase assembly protein subunit 15 n=1 Tax=Micromonospora polyrhachis TaxID=1282883 RepID=A0A7W7SV06_9ACTN|nr:COX15/CtaA family protein [Micromonospora polyrhachis]MBB4961477.1 cytochrome c oxidase assembly protein subunit 15 [Micromonospora polyrhachis]
MNGIAGYFGSPRVLRRLALASIIANIGIVVTGGAVRLTGSGLGCPTWPRCTEDSYVTTPEMGIYGMIEFGNRLLTFAVGLIALLGILSALAQRPRRKSLVQLSILVFLGVPAQAVIGGFTVLTDLNPWVVGLHFLASMAVIAAAYVFWRAAFEPGETAPAETPAPLRTLSWITTVVSAAVLVVGTWVTGSGPHAGDQDAKRLGFDPESISQAHVDLVFLLLGLSVALWFAFRAVGATVAARAALVLIAVELGQGLIGFVQYFTHLPGILVGAHMLGSCLVWLATLAVLRATRIHQPTATTGPAAPSTDDARQPEPVAAH